MKKPIAVFITDTHLFERRTKEDELVENNIDLNISLYKQAVQIVKDCGLKQLYHGGDIFHSRKSQTQTLFKVFQKRILDDIFEPAGIDLIAIPGNHDKTDYSDKYSFLSPFLHHPRFTLLEETTRQMLPNGIDLFLVPFFDDEEYIEQLKVVSLLANDKKRNILLTHIEIKGALTNGGNITDKGIDTDLFKKFELVLVGHFHNRNSINQKIHYIGAAYQHNFGEDHNKGVCILYDNMNFEFFPLDFPMYIKYDLNPKSINKKIIDNLIKENEIAHVKVVLIGDENEVNSFDRTLLKNHGIQVEKNISSVEKEQIDQRVEKFDNTTLQNHFELFCKNKKLNQKIGQKYLDKVLIK